LPNGPVAGGSPPLRNLSEFAARVAIFRPEKVDPNSFTEEFREFVKRERRKPEIRRLLAEVAPSKPASIQAPRAARAPRSRRTRTATRRGPPSDDPSEPGPPLGGPCEGGCGRRFRVATTGRPRRFCGDACRQRACRDRRSEPTPGAEPPALSLSNVTKLNAQEQAVLRDHIARIRLERQDRDNEARNARIRAEWGAE
jgi:hypothetical protein